MALSLHQPYATLLAMGRAVKAHETRSWSTRFRGTVLIHAARAWGEDQDAVGRNADRLLRERAIKAPDGYPLGYYVGAGLLSSCVRTDGFFKADPEHELDETFGNWCPGRYAWSFGLVLRFDRPVAAKGQQGLWEPSPEEIIACRQETISTAGRLIPDSSEAQAHLIGRLFLKLDEPVSADRP